MSITAKLPPRNANTKPLSRAARAQLDQYNADARAKGTPELTEALFRKKLADEQFEREQRQRFDLLANMDFNPQTTSGFLDLATNLLRLSRPQELLLQKALDPSSLTQIGKDKISDPFLRQILGIVSFSNHSDRLKEVMLVEHERAANMMLTQGMLTRSQWSRIRITCALARAIQDRVPPQNFQEITAAMIEPAFLPQPENQETVSLARVANR